MSVVPSAGIAIFVVVILALAGVIYLLDVLERRRCERFSGHNFEVLEPHAYVIRDDFTGGYEVRCSFCKWVEHNFTTITAATVAGEAHAPSPGGL